MKLSLQQKWMRLALRSAEAGIKKMEGGPFGACIVRNGRAIAVSHNTVLKTKTAISHAEVNAIRIASRKLKRFDLSDCVIYSTTEPCPMCFSAIHWARIPWVIFGTGIADVQKRGFNELTISACIMKKIGKSGMKVRGRFLIRECRALLDRWDRLADRKVY